MIEEIGKAIEQQSLGCLHSDNIRYSSMNLKALKEYGSIEFRGLPFSGDFDQIEVWTKLLLAVKDYSLTLETPRNLVENISKLGCKKLGEEVFKGLAEHLKVPNWNSMLDGVRLVQKLIYLNEWKDETNYIKLKTNLEVKKDENIKKPGNVNWQQVNPAPVGLRQQ